MENLLHKGKNVLFFDIETTGFPKKDTPIDIIEIGMQFAPTLGFSKDIETLSQLYSIEGEIPYHITQVTGIKNNMIQGKPHISEHIELIKDKVNRAEVVVAHNAPFDIRCLELIGISFEGKEVFDTATHCKRMFPELSSHTMSAMCAFLGINNKAAHRAIQDVNAMIQIYGQITDLNRHEDQLMALQKKHKKLTYTKIKK